MMAETIRKRIERERDFPGRIMPYLSYLSEEWEGGKLIPLDEHEAAVAVARNEGRGEGAAVGADDLAAAEALGMERAALIADGDAQKCKLALDAAKKRYTARGALAAIGYQGDPDAECIHTEACTATAENIAAAIRAEIEA